MTVKQAIDEVKVARTTAPGAHRKGPGKVRFGAGCERGNLLMADIDPLDFP